MLWKLETFQVFCPVKHLLELLKSFVYTFPKLDPDNGFVIYIYAEGHLRNSLISIAGSGMFMGVSTNSPEGISNSPLAPARLLCLSCLDYGPQGSW